MDAKIGDYVVTPRTGKPVEIQALWYNLCGSWLSLPTVLVRKTALIGTPECRTLPGRASRQSSGTRTAVTSTMSSSATEKTALCAPTRFLRSAYSHPLIEGERARKVVDVVERELLTPVGLRSLSPNDERYVGVYEGPPGVRDACYHQGTVWGWLIGPFVEAYRRVYAGEDGLEDRVAEMLSGFTQHLYAAGIGQVSEIFDGDPPHLPRGCPAQAWSIAELLRITRSRSR